MIIGLTGTNGGGKDSVHDFLTSKGFLGYSLSDILREECSSRGLEVNRDNLLSIGNELREKFGYGILAERIIDKIKSKSGENQNVVINSIRHPSEAEAFANFGDFHLIAVDAPFEVRVNRVMNRGHGKEDNVDAEKFRNQEQLHGSGGESQLLNVMALANLQIINDKSFEELYKKVQDFLDSISFKN